VLVVPPDLGRDMTWVAGIDSRGRAIDGNDIGPECDAVLVDAEVLLVGFPMPSGLAARAPGLRWAHDTQAGVSHAISADSTCRLFQRLIRFVAHALSIRIRIHLGWRERQQTFR
jgi:hypothetical protein